MYNVTASSSYVQLPVQLKTSGETYVIFQGCSSELTKNIPEIHISLYQIQEFKQITLCIATFLHKLFKAD